MDIDFFFFDVCYYVTIFMYSYCILNNNLDCEKSFVCAMRCGLVVNFG